MNLYDKICKAKTANIKQFALLIDPEKFNKNNLELVLDNSLLPDYIFVGGSQFTDSIYNTVECIKSRTDIPIIMFPGNASQFADNVDALLFLFLASGRNPQYLIEQQIKASPLIHKSNIETISTGYILIDGGISSAVEKVSNTVPYDSKDIDLIKDTAMACEYLGNRLIYLEAGSGAINSVPESVIEATGKCIDIPLIVGGGINDSKQIINIYNAGADLIVIGNHLEKHPEDLKSFLETIYKYNNNLL